VRNRLFVVLLAVLLASPLSEARAAMLRDVFKRVSGSVVMVVAESNARPPRSGEARAGVGGVGSGVLISPGGRVLTAAHVVESADRVRVQFAGGAVSDARVVSSDPAADVALLQVAQVPPGVIPVSLGDSGKVEVADQVFVVGAPYGISESLSVGYVSARRSTRSAAGDPDAVELFQTDATIAPGNSGGPMFNLGGEVIGIVSHIVSKSGGSEGIGFAVTSNAVRKHLLEAPALWTGLSVVPLTGELARLLNVPQPAGLLVMHSAADSPGAQLGLRAGSTPAVVGGVNLILGGDIILAVGRIPIEANGSNFRHMREQLRRLPRGEPLTVTVLRGGRIIELATNDFRMSGAD
jgi:S1-C subfamily serine protease